MTPWIMALIFTATSSFTVWLSGMEIKRGGDLATAFALTILVGVIGYSVGQLIELGKKP